MRPPLTPKGTLGAPQCGEGADGCPRKSLATVLLYRGEVRRWRTSVRYADHVTTVACRWLLCPFAPLGRAGAVCSGLARMERTVGHFAVIIWGLGPKKISIKIILNYNLSRNARYIVRSRSRKL